jgi:septal ring factor EnvC (AmiA/AmiB activator)
MDEVNTVRALLWPGLPLWGIFLVALVTAIRMTPQWMEKWVAYLQSKQAAKEQDWRRLRDEITRLDSRIKDLESQKVEQEAENERCRHDLASAVKRIAELEGYLLGQGKANQEAANIVAIERITEAERKKKP